MATTIRSGWRNLSLSRDDEGHREYTIRFVIESNDPADDGPETVLGTVGLPSIGSAWAVGNDSDPWAFCSPRLRITPSIRNEPCKVWYADYVFTTKPWKRCQTTAIEDPLLEPDDISGSFVKYTKEAARDRNGNLIKSSSHELFRGPQVEFDHNRPSVRIEQNVASLGLDTFAAMVDTVNDATLWGLAARKIKLSNVAWSRKVYGTCNYYYTRSFDFDINFDGFDRRVLDEGTKVLNGRWADDEDGSGSSDSWVLIDINGAAPDSENPQHFIRYKDRNGENTRVILDGTGKPLSDGANPYYHEIEYYSESDFTLLGIPTSL